MFGFLALKRPERIIGYPGNWFVLRQILLKILADFLEILFHCLKFFAGSFIAVLQCGFFLFRGSIVCPETAGIQ